MVEGTWGRWGSLEDRIAPDESVVASLAEQFGLHPGHWARAELGSIALPVPALSNADRSALEVIVGADHVHTEDERRLSHAGGMAVRDLLALRAGDAASAPDAIVRPGGHDEVLELLAYCSDQGIDVRPHGGGTSVTEGLDNRGGSPKGVISVDLTRIEGLVDLDEVSQIARFGAGTTGAAAEALLAQHGFTLGHTPGSLELATLGGFAATRSSGFTTTGNGRFDDMVVGLTVATPTGTVEASAVPATTSGPSLLQLFLGSEGALGVITSVRVRVLRIPESVEYRTWRFPSFAEGVAAVRELCQAGPRPAMVRLSDEAESAFDLTQPDGGVTRDRGSALLLSFEGTRAHTIAAVTEAEALLTRLGGVDEGSAPGERWASRRYSAPYKRDTMLELGVFSETLDTAAPWSSLLDVHAAIRAAIRSAGVESGVEPIVLGHISAGYLTGASLYFSVYLLNGAPLPRMLSDWAKLKHAANEAILASGGTTTHHRAIGREHGEWYRREIGPDGVRILESLKRSIDPRSVLSPGVLFGE